MAPQFASQRPLAVVLLLTILGLDTTTGVVVWPDSPPRKLYIQNTKDYVKVGDSLNISCIIEEQFFPSGVFLEKVGDTVNIEILRNYLKTIVFEEYHRYTASYVSHGNNKYTFTLHIPSVQLEDAGEYLCSVKPEIGNIPNTEKVNINVLKQADAIVLAVGTEVITSGTQLEFDDEQVRTIHCEVKGSSPASTLHLYRGDHDMTSSFQIETTEQTEATGGDVGLQASTYTTTAHADIKVTYGFSRGFRCSAMVPNLPDLSSIFVAKFKGFAPFFQNCTQSILSHMGAQAVVFKCIIISSPPASDIYISYPEDTHTENVTHTKLFPGYASGHYKFDLYEEGEQVTVTLYMDMMSPQMFRKYNLYARNEHGEAQHELHIQQGLEADIGWLGGAVQPRPKLDTDHDYLLVVTPPFEEDLNVDAFRFYCEGERTAVKIHLLGLKTIHHTSNTTTFSVTYASSTYVTSCTNEIIAKEIPVGLPLSKGYSLGLGFSGFSNFNPIPYTVVPCTGRRVEAKKYGFYALGFVGTNFTLTSVGECREYSYQVQFEYEGTTVLPTSTTPEPIIVYDSAHLGTTSYLLLVISVATISLVIS